MGMSASSVHSAITLLHVHPPDICGPRTQQHKLYITNDFHAVPEKETDPALIPCFEIVFTARILPHELSLNMPHK